MSRIGRLPISIPSEVTVNVAADNVVTVKGPKGELSQKIARELTVEQNEGSLCLTRPNNQSRLRSQHGLARTLINNMVEGVTKGHSKLLEVHGVGFRVTAEGKGLTMNLGFSHPVKVAPEEGVDFEVIVNEKTRLQSIKVSGINKYLVGQTAADIRKRKKPEPYKGKGIRYAGEVIKLKAGKRASAKK